MKENQYNDDDTTHGGEKFSPGENDHGIEGYLRDGMAVPMHRGSYRAFCRRQEIKTHVLRRMGGFVSRKELYKIAPKRWGITARTIRDDILELKGDDDLEISEDGAWLRRSRKANARLEQYDARADVVYDDDVDVDEDLDDDVLAAEVHRPTAEEEAAAKAAATPRRETA